MLVIKLGGSLMPYLPNITRELKDYTVLIVPGGGMFAEEVRKIYRKYGISQKAAHHMALLAMHQYGYLVSDISKIPLITSVEEFENQGIILPANLVINSGLEASWDNGSDTIACFIAQRVGEKQFIKLTDVEGIFLNGKVIGDIGAGKLLNTSTCVDKSLPSYLIEWKMNCRIIDGKKAENVRRVLGGEEIGTLVRGI